MGNGGALDNLRSLDAARARQTARNASTAAPRVRQEPANAAVEAAFLDTLMSPDTSTDERASALALIEPEHLFNPANQKACAAIKDLLAESSAIDPVIVSDRLRDCPAPTGGWKRYLCETIAAEGAHAEAPPSEYAKILLDHWRTREAIKVFEEGTTHCRTAVESIAIIDGAREKLSVLAASHAATSGPPATTTRDGVEDVWINITAATEGQAIGVSWGVPVLDDRIGRLQQPEYIIVGGRSGQGKTQIAWQTGLNIGNYPVDRKTGMREGMYYASYEMARKALLMRGICIEANVPTKMVLAGQIPRERNPRLDGAECPACTTEYRYDTWDSLPTNGRNERVCRVCAAQRSSVDGAPCPVPLPSPYDRLVTASELISRTPIFIDDRPCPPKELAERVKRVRDLAAEGKMKTRDGRAYPKCLVRTVVIDSIQDTPSPPGPANRNRTTEIQDTSRGVMNDIAKGCNVSVIGLAKLTREIDKQKDRRPQLKDIRECGDIEYHADEIFFVHREQYYLRDKTPPELRNIAEIIHGKGRSGLDLEAPPAKLWFAAGMFFDGPPSGWQAWEEQHGSTR